MINLLLLLLLLIGLELVLGIDNILVISIFVNKIPKKQRDRTRIIGLLLALLARVLMIYVIVGLANLRNPILFNFSIRDIILIAGGLFLIYKAVNEIHQTIELKDEVETNEESIPANSNQSLQNKGAKRRFLSVILQIVLLDIVFSIDSVITAIGLTNHILIIVLAVILSFIGILMFSKIIGEFILKHPSIKILALSFLITIGVTIFMEGLHEDVPKAYIYLPMGFALLVEMFKMRYEFNKKKKRILKLRTKK